MPREYSEAYLVFGYLLCFFSHTNSHASLNNRQENNYQLSASLKVLYSKCLIEVISKAPWRMSLYPLIFIINFELVQHTDLVSNLL